MRSLTASVVLLVLLVAAPARGQTAGASPATGTEQEVAAYIQAYANAIAKKDVAWLAAHVDFPMTVAMPEYDMEAKIRRVNFKDAKALVAKADQLAVEPLLLEQLKKGSLATLRSGVDDCSGGHTRVRWDRGAKAIQMNATSATVYAIDQPCDATTHLTVFRLSKAPNGWQLFQIGADLKYK